MLRGAIRTIGVIGFLTAASVTPGHAQALVAAFGNVSADQFTVEVAGPKDDILDFAACKGVWFAEQKKAQVISFGNPVYGVAKNLHFRGVHFQIPDGSTVVTAVVYLKKVTH